MKFVCFILLMLASSCAGERGSPKLSATVIKKGDLTLIVTSPVSQQQASISEWKDVNSVQKEWIKVEKDDDGYLIYEPCDGSTPTIKIEKNSIIYKPRIEPEATFEYSSIVIDSEGKVLKFERNIKGGLEISAYIYDAKDGLVMWRIGYDKLLMTPSKNAANYRHVKNSCPDSKKREIDFKEIQ